MKIVLPKFFDAHAHFRNGELANEVVPWTAMYCSDALAMPNTRPQPVLDAMGVIAYRKELLAVNAESWTPLMTVQITDHTTPEMVREAYKAGAVAGKVYPVNATTNSDNGLSDFNKVRTVFFAMQEVGMLLLIHGEQLGERILVTEREAEFLPTVSKLSYLYPNLRIVLEHITTKDAVDLVESLGENVAATITGHHLMLTLNDVCGSGLRPHNYCMPVAKSFTDRDALIAAATSGKRKFFLGSDSAPHLRGDKESACGCAGVYTAPVLPSILAEVFEEAGALTMLKDFTSTSGKRFYGLEQCTETISLVKEPLIVPDVIGGIVPFKAGEELVWQLMPSA